MAKDLREKLINELSELSLSLSDSLEQVGETELESNEGTWAETIDKQNPTRSENSSTKTASSVT